MTAVPGRVRVVEHHAPAAGKRFQFEVEPEGTAETVPLWGGVDTAVDVDRVLALFKGEVAITRSQCDQDACKEARHGKRR